MNSRIDTRRRPAPCIVTHCAIQFEAMATKTASEPPRVNEFFSQYLRSATRPSRHGKARPAVGVGLSVEQSPKIISFGSVVAACCRCGFAVPVPVFAAI